MSRADGSGLMTFHPRTGGLHNTDSPRLVVLTGPAGSGRTRALRDLHRDLLAAGRHVFPLRFYTDGALIPAAVPLRPTGGTIAAWNELPLRPRTGASIDDDRARRAAAATAATLAASDGVLLIDDAQWADADAMAVLEAVLRQVPRPGTRCVLTFRTPGSTAVRSPATALLTRLRRENMAVTVPLAPLRHDEVVQAIRDELDAAPSPELAAVVRARSRHVRAAVHGVLRSLVADGAVQVIDRHAYLVLSSKDEHPVQAHLLGSLRRLGTDLLITARAAAVLHPLGPATPALVAEALECDVARALERLRALVDAGFLHRGPDGRSWRFLIPALADALRADAGPYERRRLAALAVSAVWAGRARCDDTAFLTDRVAEAGTLVPLGLARFELIAAASRVAGTDARRARRWWRAVAEIAEDRSQWAMAALQESIACFLGADYDDTIVRVRRVLDEAVDQLPVESVHRALTMLLTALHNVGDVGAVESVASGEIVDEHDNAATPVRRALALGFLDRWADVRTLLEESRRARGGLTVDAALGELLEACAGVYCGDPGPFEKRLSTAGRWIRNSNETHWRYQVRTYASVLLCLGDLRRCEDLLARQGLPESELYLGDRATVDLLRGRGQESTDVLGRARGALAVGIVHGHDFGHAQMCQTAGALLAAQGRLVGSRDLLRRARARGPNLAYLLEVTEAQIELVLGERAAAEERLRATVDWATEQELVIGTDTFHAELAQSRLMVGDHPAAHRHLADLRHVHRRLPTARSDMLISRLQAQLDHDPVVAARSVDQARERRVPWDLAIGQLVLVEAGLLDPTVLLETYAIFGDYDALLARAWTRNVMTTRGVAIPGRQVTVAENDRLLAVLIGEGITNRQAATVLRASEKSVEGRLSRLFARSGHQSRLELANAVRRGGLSV